YQGIVPLDGANVATVIENYMLRSEQLDTRLWLAADGNVTRGLLLQKLPEHGGKAASHPHEEQEHHELDTWNRVLMLASTLNHDELLATDVGTLMRRLFCEDSVRRNGGSPQRRDLNVALIATLAAANGPPYC